jgi:predicted DNA-binding transcriptional regulator AlpA
MTDELDKLRDEFISEMKMGCVEEAHRTLAKRDKLILTELVTGADIARLFGVQQSAISNWIKRPVNFPAPRTGSARTARYSRTEVVQWWAARHPDLVKRLRALED